MQLVNATLRAQIKGMTDAQLTDTCVIEQETETRGSMGEPIIVWELVAANVPCRVIKPGQANTNAGDIVANQETLQDLYRLIVPNTVALGVDQRVTTDGFVYNIVRIETALTDDVFHMALITRRL